MKTKVFYQKPLLVLAIIYSSIFFASGQAEGINPNRPWWILGNNGTNDPGAPVTYGTSLIGANENWIGTMDANDFVLGTNNKERLRVKQTTGYVGIGNAAPSSRLDIEGDLALRIQALPLIAGANNNINPASLSSFYRVTGPTGNFIISGFAGGVNGKIMTIFNPTVYSMTISELSGSLAANQIITGGGGPLVIADSGTVTLQYNVTDTKWVVVSFSNGVYSSQPGPNWKITGNAGTNPASNFIGTTDAQDWVIRTSNTERARVLANGNVGIGAVTPAVKLAINGDGVNVYGTDLWVERNAHVQGNETLTQGGRGRMRVGTAWGYVGLYAEPSSTSVANDLILGASSGFVRVGPGINNGQHLRWSNSLLRDNQGGSIELGGNDQLGYGGTGTPYIDWHVNDGYARDYDIRMIAQTDGFGPIMTWYTYATNTLYRYLDLDWIGTYDCWADVSAWRYYANASNWLYWDVVNDLDAIDNMKPKPAIDPKSGKPVLIYDPTTAPEFLAKKSKSENGADSYIYDVSAVANFSLGAIRQLRAETKTSNEGQDARIARLEKIVADLTGKESKDIEYAGKATVYAGVTKYVVMDGRVKPAEPINVRPVNSEIGYKIVDQAKGSFTILLDAPATADIIFLYTGILK